MGDGTTDGKSKGAIKMPTTPRAGTEREYSMTIANKESSTTHRRQTARACKRARQNAMFQRQPMDWPSGAQRRRREDTSTRGLPKRPIKEGKRHWHVALADASSAQFFKTSCQPRRQNHKAAKHGTASERTRALRLSRARPDANTQHCWLRVLRTSKCKFQNVHAC